VISSNKAPLRSTINTVFVLIVLLILICAAVLVFFTFYNFNFLIPYSNVNLINKILNITIF
jgi:hypothetical protein